MADALHHWVRLGAPLLAASLSLALRNRRSAHSWVIQEHKGQALRGLTPSWACAIYMHIYSEGAPK